jgi:hypothetical protein
LGLARACPEAIPIAVEGEGQRAGLHGLCASSSATWGGQSGWPSGLAKPILLVLLQIVQVEVAVRSPFSA